VGSGSRSDANDLEGQRTGQAAAGDEIARLRRELGEALERESAVRGVLSTISRSSFDLDLLLQTVIESAVRLSNADFGNILRLEEETGLYRQIAQHGLTPDFWEVLTEARFAPERGTLVGRTLLERRPVHIEDVLEDSEYRLWEAQRVGGYRTILGVPMLRDGFPIGVIVLNRREVIPFTDREISLLTTFADQAVLAIEQVRLFQTAERQRAELARFAPEVAKMLSNGDEQLLAGHRREITALFCDLRGFTAFAETAEPEEILGVLRQYHSSVGELVVPNAGTVSHFAGDGLLVFFNDPTPVPNHQLVAIYVALHLHERFGELASGWSRRGYQLGLGIGAASGFATLGRIGFEGRYEYGAIGNVATLASRLSDVAKAGETLVSQRLYASVEGVVKAEPVTPLQLKGFSRPTPAFRVVGLDESTKPIPVPLVDPAARYGLTRRERKVLELLAAGQTNRQIAEKLLISEKTASVHVSNILRKLSASSRAEAAGLAFRLHLVTTQPSGP
jgi:adenylate cyclase